MLELLKKHEPKEERHERNMSKTDRDSRLGNKISEINFHWMLLKHVRHFGRKDQWTWNIATKTVQNKEQRQGKINKNKSKA